MFDFPSSPTNGQQFTPFAGAPTYVWQSPVWRIASGGVNSGVKVSETPPLDPVQGMLWYESDSGNTFIWYDDGSSAQWVQFNVAPPIPPLQFLKLPEQVSAPTTTGEEGVLYTRDVAAETELFYRHGSLQAQLTGGIGNYTTLTGLQYKEWLFPTGADVSEIEVMPITVPHGSAGVHYIMMITGAGVQLTGYGGAMSLVANGVSPNVILGTTSLYQYSNAGSGNAVTGIIRAKRMGASTSGVWAITGIVASNLSTGYVWTSAGWWSGTGPVIGVRIGTNTTNFTGGAAACTWR